MSKKNVLSKNDVFILVDTIRPKDFFNFWNRDLVRYIWSNNWDDILLFSGFGPKKGLTFG